MLVLCTGSDKFENIRLLFRILTASLDSKNFAAAPIIVNGNRNSNIR